MKVRNIVSSLACMVAVGAAGIAQAAPVNGSFESNFSGWTVTGDGYLVTQTGNTRTRHDYQTYQGWEGSDVWFGAPAKEGSNFAVFGSKGNESDGSLTSALWTASNQFLSFWQAGNNSSGQAASSKAFAQILDDTGAVLATQAVTSYNDSVWRQWSFDLAALGLQAGDQFRFRYQDNWSWSVIDHVADSGPALPGGAPANNVPEPGSLALAGLGALMLGLRRRAR
jgi:PEP-CTERM motif